MPTSEKYFRIAVEAAPNAMVMVDAMGVIVLVNAQTEKLFGYEREELLGQPVEILVPESSRTIHSELRNGHISDFPTQKIGAGRELLAQRKDGTQFPVEIGLNPIETQGGVWVLSSIVDITERRQAEALARKSDEHFRQMADSTPAMMWVSGPDKLVVFCNKGWLNFTGMRLEQALGTGWTERVHPDDLERAYDDYSSGFDARRTFHAECRMRQADGEYRWVQATGSPRFESNGEFAGYIGTCTDVTDIKRAQELALGRHLLENLGQLAGGIAHDFNNLLAGILASSELLVAEQPAGIAPSQAMLNIRTAAVRGSEIVRQLMTYGRAESLASEPVDVSSLVEEMLQLLRVSISKHATLKTELAEGLPAVFANAAQIRQIVMNLVTNASEAIGDRDAAIRVTTAVVHVGPESPRANLAPGDYLKLEVSDAGPGMTPEMRAKIFEPYFTTKSTGRGLGLAMVQEIVRAHEGAIHVESSLGEGSRFEILLPCPGQQARENPDVVIPAGDWQGQNQTVLVVEDEDLLRRAISKLLRMKGFSIIEASDGATAVDLFRAHKRDISVVLLDMTLPEIGGPEVFATLRKIQPNVKVILTTAHSHEATLAAFHGAKGSPFIRKPYRLTDLLNLLREVCSTTANVGRAASH